ncbi:unnamed protein product [Rotaria socialis]|uniref:AB hydrolase-1 domain-containing protein n=1 Tax=Rotaria socialis TaxID=392032 RepID=A0A820QAA1_9BILA|nr:unnamed protein product [Rotaria socialis]CAF3410831.1 unnamed protein product [Rotaria socialis]CAF3466101.1 unnamed protein product [Rotaria socialis]CAF4130391.1 unnamed protein product [Rotaria socialis]CAF4418557.1 unnamed protein product [Rotaria socialis]
MISKSVQTQNDDQQYIYDEFEAENFEVASGINYEYIYIKANNNNNNNTKATFLFLHGFPESFHSWKYQVEYFAHQNFDCLMPNLMGYGKTYSPLDMNEYKLKSMVNHLGSLLDYLNLNKVIVVGHDWGTQLANRFVLYYPQRTLGLVMINGGYGAPALFDLDLAIEYSKQVYGYETLGYWKFFIADDAAEIMENNVESFTDLGFAKDPLLWKTDLAPIEKLRNWLLNGNTTTRASYMTDDDYKNFRQYIVEGMKPKLNWYKSQVANINWNDEMSLDPIIQRPVLSIGGTKDYVVIASTAAEQKRYIADLDIITLEAAHWTMIEKSDEVNRAMHIWTKRILSM